MASSNCVLLEHVNLNINSAPVFTAARRLFIEALGCFDDPRPLSMRGRHKDNLLWANMGLQQFHLPLDLALDTLANAGSDRAMQQLDGVIHIEIALGSSAPIFQRLVAIGESPKFVDGGVSVRALGNAFILLEEPAHEQKDSINRARRFVGGDATVCRGQPGFTRTDPADDSYPCRGIRGLTINAPGAALGCIVNFWREVMGARTETYPEKIRVHFDGPVGATRAPGGEDGELNTLDSQWIDFVECDALLPYDGHHIAIYLRDWEAAYIRAAEAGALYHGTRFGDRCTTLTEAKAFHQFRTLAMRSSACACAPESACAKWGLELEVRALSHAACPL